MKTWCIFGAGLPDLHIKANTFDEAIDRARKRDNNYTGGFIVASKGKKHASFTIKNKKGGKR